MSMLDGLLIFLSMLFAYFLLVMLLHKKGVLKKYNISFWGPALLLRTKKGKIFLKRIAKRKKFWKIFGNFGIVFCFAMMFLMIAMLVWQAWFVFGFTPEQKEVLPGPEFALPFPGINPVLPLEYAVYIILALAVAVVVHEFSHGILTFASKLKVKSLGILYFVVPLGAFCEPDEKQLLKTKDTNRMRIFAAGPTMNFAVVFISILLFSLVFMSSVQLPNDGVCILSVGKNTPAEKIGLASGMILTHINDTEVTNVTEFFYAMERTRSNQTINISYAKSDTIYNKNVTLADKYEEYSKRNYTNNESYMGKGYIGIGPSDMGISRRYLDILKNPFTHFPNDFLYFYSLPFLGYLTGYTPIVSPFVDFYVIEGVIDFIPNNIFWIIVNAIYWIFWLNLAVALFNVLPAVPLDGGYLFKDGINFSLKRIRRGLSDEKRKKIVGNVSLITSLLILFLIVFPFLVKYF